MAHLFTYGTGRYYLKQDLIDPTKSIKQIVDLQGVGIKDDFMQAVKTYPGFGGGRSIDDIINKIVDPSKYSKFMDQLFTVTEQGKDGKTMTKNTLKFPSFTRSSNLSIQLDREHALA